MLRGGHNNGPYLFDGVCVPDVQDGDTCPFSAGCAVVLSLMALQTSKSFFMARNFGSLSYNLDNIINSMTAYRLKMDSFDHTVSVDPEGTAPPIPALAAEETLCTESVTVASENISVT